MQLLFDVLAKDWGWMDWTALPCMLLPKG